MELFRSFAAKESKIEHSFAAKDRALFCGKRVRNALKNRALFAAKD